MRSLLRSVSQALSSGRKRMRASTLPCHTSRLAPAALAALWLAGCAVGPDYVRPALPVSHGYAPTPQPLELAPAATVPAQRLAVAADIRADWWKVFESPVLDALIVRAFDANPSIEAAQAALRAAQANVYAQRGFFFPTIQASYSPSRTKIAGNLGGNSPGIQGNGTVIATREGTPASEGGTAPFNGPVIYNFHTAQLTVGYVPDVFGGNRRQAEALEAQQRYQRLQLEAAYLTLASNVVAAAIQDALLRQQLALTEQMIEAQMQSVALVQRQFKAGHVSRVEVAMEESALAQTRQLLAPLRQQFEHTRSLLRALAGNVQDQDVPEVFSLDTLHLPSELPLSLPAQVIEQRPDIRAAEAQLQAASAMVGVAIANRLPQLSITAALGGAASNIGQMFWNSGRFFDLIGGLTQPLFDGGTLKQRQRAAEAEFEQARAQYKSTVIQAFQNVADTLHTLRSDAETHAAADASARAAHQAMTLTQRQFRGGQIDRLALITAEQANRQAQLNLAQARAARLGSAAALFQALGGGWWHRTEEDATAAAPATSVPATL